MHYRNSGLLYKLVLKTTCQIFPTHNNPWLLPTFDPLTQFVELLHGTAVTLLALSLCILLWGCDGERLFQSQHDLINLQEQSTVAKYIFPPDYASYNPNNLSVHNKATINVYPLPTIPLKHYWTGRYNHDWKKRNVNIRVYLDSFSDALIIQINNWLI